mmetsp:Transcript_7098/g.29372  ORF Transcript_7098/g.29372 Transcript_7098/m.29372 type:complete len:267 (+) Transcript_7098:1893-2693(+)
MNARRRARGRREHLARVVARREGVRRARLRVVKGAAGDHPVALRELVRVRGFPPLAPERTLAARQQLKRRELGVDGSVRLNARAIAHHLRGGHGPARSAVSLVPRDADEVRAPRPLRSCVEALGETERFGVKRRRRGLIGEGPEKVLDEPAERGVRVASRASAFAGERRDEALGRRVRGRSRRPGRSGFPGRSGLSGGEPRRGGVGGGRGGGRGFDLDPAERALLARRATGLAHRDRVLRRRRRPALVVFRGLSGGGVRRRQSRDG